MVGNPQRWRAVVPQLEHRHSTAGCLLAFLFFVPILAKTFHISVSVVSLFTVIYVSIIVPIGTGIISKKYIVGGIRKLTSLVFDEQLWNHYMTQLTYISIWISYIYLQVEGVQTFTTQIAFNIAAEKLLCPSQKFSCLYVLLYYCFLAYVVKSLNKRPWAHLSNDMSMTEYIKLTAAFVIVRLGKGVAATFALLTFTYHFSNIEPTYTFIIVTFLYFYITQFQSQVFVKSFLVDCLIRLELQYLDGLEEYWEPVIVHFSEILMSLTVFIGLLLHTNNYLILVTLGYFNIFIPFKYLLMPVWEVLSEQKAIVSKYPLASWNNAQIKGGYPCAVCLDKMRAYMARVTPCGHVFHGSCLRKCLQHSKHCPLCKNVL